MCHPIGAAKLACYHRKRFWAPDAIRPDLVEQAQLKQTELSTPTSQYLVNEKNHPPLFNGDEGFGGSK